MKRDPIEIMEEILELLEREHCALTINSIAKKTGLHYLTIKRYIKIIEMIRSMPEIEIIRTDRSVIIRLRRD